MVTRGGDPHGDAYVVMRIHCREIRQRAPLLLERPCDQFPADAADELPPPRIEHRGRGDRRIRHRAAAIVFPERSRAWKHRNAQSIQQIAQFV